MIRPSGKLKRFMSNADYQVSTKRTKKKNPSSVRWITCNEIGCRSDVAPAPLKFLPDYAGERRGGQRGQWKRFLCFADGHDRIAFNVDRSAAVQRQINWIIG